MNIKTGLIVSVLLLRVTTAQANDKPNTEDIVRASISWQRPGLSVCMRAMRWWKNDKMPVVLPRDRKNNIGFTISAEGSNHIRIKTDVFTEIDGTIRDDKKHLLSARLFDYAEAMNNLNQHVVIDGQLNMILDEKTYIKPGIILPKFKSFIFTTRLSKQQYKDIWDKYFVADN